MSDPTHDTWLKTLTPEQHPQGTALPRGGDSERESSQPPPEPPEPMVERKVEAAKQTVRDLAQKTRTQGNISRGEWLNLFAAASTAESVQTSRGVNYSNFQEFGVVGNVILQKGKNSPQIVESVFNPVTGKREATAIYDPTTKTTYTAESFQNKVFRDTVSNLEKQLGSRLTPEEQDRVREALTEGREDVQISRTDTREASTGPTRDAYNNTGVREGAFDIVSAMAKGGNIPFIVETEAAMQNIKTIIAGASDNGFSTGIGSGRGSPLDYTFLPLEEREVLAGIVPEPAFSAQKEKGVFGKIQADLAIKSRGFTEQELYYGKIAVSLLGLKGAGNILGKSESFIATKAPTALKPFQISKTAGLTGITATAGIGSAGHVSSVYKTQGAVPALTELGKTLLEFGVMGKAFNVGYSRGLYSLPRGTSATELHASRLSKTPSETIDVLGRGGEFSPIGAITRKGVPGRTTTEIFPTEFKGEKAIIEVSPKGTKVMAETVDVLPGQKGFYRTTLEDIPGSGARFQSMIDPKKSGQLFPKTESDPMIGNILGVGLGGVRAPKATFKPETTGLSRRVSGIEINLPAEFKMKTGREILGLSKSESRTDMSTEFKALGFSKGLFDSGLDMDTLGFGKGKGKGKSRGKGKGRTKTVTEAFPEIRPIDIGISKVETGSKAASMSFPTIDIVAGSGGRGKVRGPLTVIPKSLIGIPGLGFDDDDILGLKKKRRPGQGQIKVREAPIIIPDFDKLFKGVF